MVAFLSKATKCGSGHPPADLRFRGAVYLKPAIGPSEAMVQRNSMDKLDFQNIDLVSEINKRRKAMATRDETITKKSGEGGEMLPSMGMDQESPSKAHLMVPPAPPPSPADAADISKYKLNSLMGVDIGANTRTHLGCLGGLLKIVPEVLDFLPVL
ncbi:myocilin opposite strand protein-like [Mus caroli]|uniref:Myocilin opposite strand protein-like n=1 Tax=Mus caroli TaxID=10089 RepID=A0A6P7R3S3_MUSCR|nr:myocilin opposite strand protein-like [Mus caroli]